MGEASFVKRVMGQPAGQSGETPEWRKAFGGDNAGSANPFSLSLRFKDGGQYDGFSMSLYVRHHWNDHAGNTDRLILIFSAGGVYVEGLHLRHQVEALLEEGKLKRIQEHDSAEVAAIRRCNLDKRKAEEKEPIVLRIVVSPSIEDVLERDENLAAIAEVLKGETRENRRA